VGWRAAALAKIVLSSAVPIEPPICCPVLSVAEATPASCGGTPNVAVFIDGAMVKPRPQAGRHQRAEDRRGVARTRADLGQPDQAGRGEQHPGGD